MMDYCWHCPICDVTMAAEDMSPQALEDLKASAASGESTFYHEGADGAQHPIHLIAVRH